MSKEEAAKKAFHFLLRQHIKVKMDDPVGDYLLTFLNGHAEVIESCNTEQIGLLPVKKEPVSPSQAECVAIIKVEIERCEAEKVGINVAELMRRTVWSRPTVTRYIQKIKEGSV